MTLRFPMRFCAWLFVLRRFNVMIKPPLNSVQLKSRAEWRTWLKKNHKQNEGVWAVTYKKASGQPHVSYEDLVEEALCFGWIDTKGNKLDDERTMLWMAPRKAGSNWSKLNKTRVEKLLASGLMEAPGLAKIESAKKGRDLDRPRSGGGTGDPARSRKRAGC